MTGSTRGSDPQMGSEPDALGVNAGTAAPPPEPPDYDTGASDLIIPRHADALNLAAGCTIDRMPASCDLVDSMLENGSAEELVTYAYYKPKDKPIYIDSPMPDIPSPTGNPDSPTTAFAYGASYSMSASGRSSGKKPDCPPGTKARKDGAGEWQCVGTGVSNVTVKASSNYVFSSFMQGQSTGLSPCMRNLLSSEFSSVKVENTSYNVVNDAKFISGIPAWVSAFKSPAAITLGLYNINYDPNKLDINGGNDWRNIRTVAEELIHAEQFLNVWQDNFNRRKNDAKGTQVKVDVSYSDAQAAWKGAYAAESAKIIAYNAATLGSHLPSKDSYNDNKYEVEAKQRAATIVQTLQNQGKKPCP